MGVVTGVAAMHIWMICAHKRLQAVTLAELEALVVGRGKDRR